MRDGWLGEVDAFFDVAGAESVLCDGRGVGGSWAALLQGVEDAAAGGVGDGVERVVE